MIIALTNSTLNGWRCPCRVKLTCAQGKHEKRFSYRNQFPSCAPHPSHQKINTPTICVQNSEQNLSQHAICKSHMCRRLPSDQWRHFSAELNRKKNRSSKGWDEKFILLPIEGQGVWPSLCRYKPGGHQTKAYRKYGHSPRGVPLQKGGTSSTCHSRGPSTT